MIEHYKNLSLKDIDGEIWKDIEDFEGYYQVSNMGRVKSLKREIIGSIIPRMQKEQIMKQQINHKSGNHKVLTVILRKPPHRYGRSVNRLVFDSFISKIFLNENFCTCHLNRNNFDNRVSNLSLISYADMNGRNHREKGAKTSTYRGVSKTIDNTFLLSIQIKDIKIANRFKTELEAAKKYDYYVKKYKLNRELNFPDE